MGRVSASTLATACVVFALAAGACGDGERSDPRAPGFTSGGAGGTTLGGNGGGQLGGSAGEAGAEEVAGDGSGALGGTGDGSGGSPRGGSGGSRPRGGAGGADNGPAGGGTGATTGGTAGDAANGGSGGAGAEAGEVGAAGGGTGGKPVVEQLDVCIRQTSSPSVLGWDVSRDFESAVNLDCRINWVRLLYLDPANGLDERVDFLNQLIHFGLDTWGCLGAAPPQRFDLIWVPAPLSAADVAVLIDHYVEAAKGPLTLSPGEIADLRTVLGNLAEPLLMEPDPGDFSNSRCVETGSGGESGAGGQAGSG